MNDLAYRMAWNRGFNERFAQMQKEATGLARATGAGVRAFRNAPETIAKTYGGFKRQLGAKRQAISDAYREGLTGKVNLKPQANPEAWRDTLGMPQHWEDVLGKAPGGAGKVAPAGLPAAGPGTIAPDGLPPVGGAVTGNAASPLGWQIPRATGWGATHRNWMADKLWNERGTGGRIGVGVGAAHLLGTHNQARGAQKAYDDFAEAHPILATFGRFAGVQRPGYGGAFASRFLNPTNALGIF